MGVLPDFSLAASDPSNPNATLGTPSQLAQRQAMANALLKQGADTSPIRSGWQGAARLVQGLMGGWQEGKLEQDDAKGNAQLAAAWAKASQPDGISAASPDPQKLAAGLLNPSDSQNSAPAFDPQKMVAALQGYGYNPPQIAGIVGNLQTESNLNPTAVGDNGTAHGLAQWRDSRWQGLQDFAKQQGTAPSDPQTQVAYLDYELKNKEPAAYAALQSAKTPADAATAFMGFERPGGWTANNPMSAPSAPSRIANANAAMAFTGSTPQAPAAASINAVAGPPAAPAPGATGAQVAPSPVAAAPQAISVPGYKGTFTRAQADAAAENDASTPGTDEWDKAASLLGAKGSSPSGAAPTPSGTLAGQPAAAPTAAPVASSSHPYNTQALISILSNPYASPAMQQVAASMLQTQMKPKEPVTVGSGSSLVDPVTHKEIYKNASDDKFSTVDFNGHLFTLNKKTGGVAPASAAEAVGSGYRPMTPQEKQAYNVPPMSPVYVGPDGKPSGIGGGTNVNVNTGENPGEAELSKAAFKPYADLAGGIEGAQGRARDIAAMQGAVDAIQKNGGTTGFGQQQLVKLQQVFNAGANSLGLKEPFDVSDKEFLTKFNRAIAGAQAKDAVGNRVTNFELANYLKSNPGLEMSTTGNQRLLGIQAQIEQRNIAAGNAIQQAISDAYAAGKKPALGDLHKIVTDYDSAHHISDPVTGQDLTQSYALPEFQGGPNAPMAVGHEQNINGIKIRRLN